MPFVERDSDTRAIKGCYASAQPGYADEFLTDSDPEVVAYFSPSLTAEQQRIAALKANARTAIIVAALTTKDDVGLIAAVQQRYPSLAGDGLKAVTDIALALATIYRAG